MSMASYCHGPPLMLLVCPFNVAEAPVMLAVPKLASGNTPPDHGASTIHSADERFADGSLWDVVNVQPLVEFCNVSTNLPPMYWTSALNTSPAATGARIMYGNLGY